MGKHLFEKGLSAGIGAGLSGLGATVAGPFGAAFGGALGGLIGEQIGESVGVEDCLSDASVDLAAFGKRAEAFKAEKAKKDAPKDGKKAEAEKAQQASLQEQQMLLAEVLQGISAQAVKMQEQMAEQIALAVRAALAENSPKTETTTTTA